MVILCSHHYSNFIGVLLCSGLLARCGAKRAMGLADHCVVVRDWLPERNGYSQTRRRDDYSYEPCLLLQQQKVLKSYVSEF